ncbi:MAG: sugar phosphate isomerase/epimerase [Puniceicoccales bacterium]|jgi:sugar phosphate isomerase/epimerase|nr:sugar phosphate isomerase/epimerase [Puniceicoccales bacterium]
MLTRRSFFKQTGLGVAATVTPALLAGAAANFAFTGNANAAGNGAATGGAGSGSGALVPAQIVGAKGVADSFRLGAAGYTFVHFKLEKTLEMLRRVDVHYLCIKDFHLPLNSAPEQIEAFHARCAAAGVTGYAVGPIYVDSEKKLRANFEYAKRVGVKLLVGVPCEIGPNKKRRASAKLVKLAGKLVADYDIRYAIHNHGPDMPELFPNAESGIELIGDADPRLGLCLDIGHELRDGRDPVAAVLKYAPRIHDIHIKNVTAASKAGRGIELPRGKIDFPAFVRALRKVGYTGVCSLEYEKDMKDPLLGIAESIGYFRGVMDATR